MSEDAKSTKGRTMIGTVGPVVPRTGHPTPAVTPTGSASMPVVTPPGVHSAVYAVAPGSTSLPTVGLGPASTQPPPQLGADPLIGQELCGYTIRRKLAEGGMGEVYEGEHQKIGRLGAIKLLKLELCRSEEVVERFRQEARAVNAIRHENIVDIYDFGRDPNGRVFFVMEYLEGEPLAQRIRRGALTWSDAFPILEQTLRALKAAHDKGFVHRDLKPDNIWLKYVDGRVQVKLLDFGIAKLVGSESPREKLTQTGSVIGTPHYMSPEQINGSRDIDQRTDIYALGVIMYEMFAGVTPFVGETLQAIMTGHLFKEPPRLADIPDHLGVPAPIAEIIDRMLVKDAGARYATVSDVLSDVYDVNGNRTPTLADTMNRQRPARGATVVAFSGQAKPAQPGKGSRKALIAFVGLGVVAAGIGGAVVLTRGSSTPARTEQVAVAPVPVKEPVKAPTPPPPPPVIDRDDAKHTAQATLRSSLKEVEPSVRAAGEDALGKIKDAPSVPALTELTEHDADDSVKGHAAEALGTIGADSTRALLGKLETAAPPALRVWYASALARLGDAAARKRLLTYAQSKDLAVSFKAGLALADVSKPGDKPVIGALRALAGREAELKDYDAYAGAVLLTKAAALHDADSRKVLYSLLDNDLEGVQLAAAEGLAKLGDDAGKKVLANVAGNAASPNRLPAAVAQIPLGEYGGIDVIMQSLTAKDAETRRLAARGLGEIGEVGNDRSLRALIDLAKDKDWRVRIAAAQAIVEIIGLDPIVLAQASVDWTKDALTSQDWAVRRAAAGVLSDIPAKDAVPLLAQAIADKSPDVRLAASRSAGKIKTVEAAAQVASAVKTETDPKVKEQQVRALGQIGEIGGTAAHDALAEISGQPGRLGVFAAGSLIAFGDLAGKAKLEQAVASTQPAELRLAAVEAAGAANNVIVVPTLKTGLLDKLFDVRFAAAEGLAGYMDEKAAAVPVLTAALEQSKNTDVIGRAIAALTRLGETPKNKSQTPAELINSPDPRLRLSAVPAVREMQTADSVPLLRRLIADQDQDVRRAGVDAIEAVASKDKDRDQAIKLYKPLVNDADPMVRSKAAGQLARLVKAPVVVAAVAPATPPVVAAVAPAAGPDPKVAQAIADARTASSEADTVAAEFDGLAREQAAVIAATQHDDTTVAKVNDLTARARRQAEALDAAVSKIEAAVKEATTAAGSGAPGDSAQLIADTQPLLKRARDAARDGHERTAKLVKAADDYQIWKGDIEIYITEAKTEIAIGNFAAAKAKLGEAKAKLAKGTRNLELDDTYGSLYLKMAQVAEPADKRKLFQQAQEMYQRVVKGGGARGGHANEHLAEIADELKSVE